MNTGLPPIAMLKQVSQCKQLVSISKREYIHYSSRIVSLSFLIPAQSARGQWGQGKMTFTTAF